MPSEEPLRRPETLAITAGRPVGDGGEPLNTPITPASTYRSANAPARRGTDLSEAREYSRSDGTDTSAAFEAAIGALEGGQAVSYSSGMAAISAILDCLPVEAKIVAPTDLYQGAAYLLERGQKRLGWQVMRLDTADTELWLKAIPGADLAWIESPSNPLLEIADVPALCQKALDADVATVVDNTFATPLLQQPLSLGATFSLHSATKFIGGHSDLLSGVIVTADDDVYETMSDRRTYGGATPGVLESFLALRGLRTLPVRLAKAQENANELAQRLEEHRSVRSVRYPGLPSHPGHDLASDTLAGPGAVLSFEIAGSAIGTDVRLSRLKIITPATSLGGVESTIERRAKLAGQEHLPESLCRLSVGCEHIDDLWEDLSQALDGGV